ncbi:hypothetical protein MMC15_000353 [Xylographa vitiligo]|nr:hypothetical protein [Xylographa vitiligo]
MSNINGSQSNSAAEPPLHDPFSIIPTEFQVEILDKIWCSVKFYRERDIRFGGPLPKEQVFEMLKSHFNVHYGPNSKGQRYDQDEETPMNVTVISTFLDLETIRHIWDYINRPAAIPDGETWDTYRVKHWVAQWDGINQPKRRGEIGYTAVTMDEGGPAFDHMVARRYLWPENRKKACRAQERIRRGRFVTKEMYKNKLELEDWRFFGYMSPDPSHPEPNNRETVSGVSATATAERRGATWEYMDNCEGMPSVEPI